MNFYVHNGLKRINKSTARRLHKEGKHIFICPVYFRPDNMYAPASPISTEEDFDTTVMYYEHYNCINSETGRYAAFYTEMEG
jgi:hypothetical protein